MIGGYFKFDKDLTKKGKYVCTKIEGSYKGLEYFRNRRGEIVLFLSEARSFVNANPKRQAQWALVNKINFSSIFTFNNENQGFILGYGNPNKSKHQEYNRNMRLDQVIDSRFKGRHLFVLE